MEHGRIVAVEKSRMSRPRPQDKKRSEAKAFSWLCRERGQKKRNLVYG